MVGFKTGFKVVHREGGADVEVEMAGCGEGSVSMDVKPGLDTMRPWEVLYAVGQREWESPVPVMLQSLTKALSEAAAWIGKPAGERELAFELLAFCKNLPEAIGFCMDDAEMAISDENRAHVFEVLCALVEFTVAFLSECVRLEEELCLPALTHILEAMASALDSDMRYYSKARNCREILVLSSRLEFALRVPGCIVRVHDDDKSLKHYFCAQRGVPNQLGLASCLCCRIHSGVDAVLVSVYWHLASGYELLLKILRTKIILDAFERKCVGDHGSHFALEIMALIMRPFAQVLIERNSWRVVVQRLEESFADGDMMRSCCLAFGNVFQSLKKALVDKRDGLTPFDSIFSSQKVFMSILLYLEAVRRSSFPFERDVWWHDNPGDLLILYLDRVDESKAADVVCRVLGEFLDCAQGLKYEVPFVKNILQWLKEGEVILRFVTLKCDTKMIRLVEFAGKQGLIMKEEVFLKIINHDCVDPIAIKQPLNERCARARVVATILKNYKMDAYNTKTKESVCKWMQRWKVKDLVSCILERLVECDKDRRLKTSLLDLLWKRASDLTANESLSCMTKIASHYTSIAEPKTMIHPGEETENFLRACSTADEECSVSRHVGSRFEDKAVIEQRAKTYQDMEVNSHFETSLQLQRLLDINTPLSVYETSTECLKRLGLAQQLISGLETTTRFVSQTGSQMLEAGAAELINNMASVVSSAVAPELRTLEAIKKEIESRPVLCQKMQDAQERHLRVYDAVKRTHYNALKKLFQDFLEEKERIVRDALLAKAEVLAAVEMGKLQSKRESNPDVIRTRVFQKVENTLEEFEERHRKSLEEQPSLECSVCFIDFSAKRKRACFDPCGHAGTCIDCGMQEWKRRKACPLCRCTTMKPLAVPSTLFL